MAKPKISVVIPTYQEEKYIGNTLRALRNQDYDGAYEIIVADGGSRDRTVRIARKYADKVVVEKEKRPGAERNAGAKVAKGGILLFLDADTILLFNGLGKIAKAFDDRHVVGATCNVVPISSNVSDFMMYWVYNKFTKHSINTRNVKVGGACMACRRSAFERVGGFNKKFETNEDYHLTERLSKLGKFAFVEDTIALTSPRRLVYCGRWKTASRTTENYIRYTLFKKPLGLDKFELVR